MKGFIFALVLLASCGQPTASDFRSCPKIKPALCWSDRRGVFVCEVCLPTQGHDNRKPEADDYIPMPIYVPQ